METDARTASRQPARNPSRRMRNLSGGDPRTTNPYQPRAGEITLGIALRDSLSMRSNLSPCQSANNCSRKLGAGSMNRVGRPQSHGSRSPQRIAALKLSFLMSCACARGGAFFTFYRTSAASRRPAARSTPLPLVPVRLVRTAPPTSRATVARMAS